MNILEAKSNHFKGIEVDGDYLPEETAVFQQHLTHSLQVWRDGGFRLIWLKIPIGKAQLIPVAVDAGFQFHHSSDDYLMLTRQLVANAHIPPYATHYIGAGGVVVNDKNELLVVWERSHRTRRYYKLPGGAIHAGEHIADGVMREVFEETGIRTEFRSLAFFRHWHGYRYGKSDIYFVCRLNPLSSEIKMQDDEIQECLWMPLDEYLNHDNVGLFNKRIVELAIKGKGLQSDWFDGYEPDPSTRELFLPQTE